MDKNTLNAIKTAHLDETGTEIDKRQLELKTAEYLKTNYGINVGEVFDKTYKSSTEFENEIKKHIPDNFCLYPFVHFQLDPDGRSRPCCKYGVGGNWEKDVPKLPTYNIGELWNQEEIKELRSQFLKNERPDACKACWDEEAAGITSMRLSRETGGKMYPYATIFKNILKPYPESLDLKLSNLCNLKCRICTPFLSTQWIKEVKDLNITDTGTQDMYVHNSREKFLENSENEVVLKQWAPSITSMEFYGGEPLLQQEHDQILNIISEYGNPDQVGVHYNTNGTICEEKFFPIWKKFKYVNISFSIDDIGERYEYERKNAKWNEVVHNLHEYARLKEKYNVNLHTRIYITVSILNAFYLKEIIDYLKQFDMEFVFNNVHYPKHYAIFNLPIEIKNKFKEKMLEIPDDFKITDWSPNIQQLINFMYVHEPDLSEFDKFLEKTAMHDSYRNESFSKTFPHLNEVIKNYKGLPT